MHAAVEHVHELVAAIHPHDDLEAEHRTHVLSWLSTTDDVFRRAKPATPDKHLVSYVCLIDPDDGSTLLVDHINACLWLPPGGHVEPGERPADCARREVREELSLAPAFADPYARPSFVTVTQTVGMDAGHTDVSLWFVMHSRRSTRLEVDESEVREARRWTVDAVEAAPPSIFDPQSTRDA